MNIRAKLLLSVLAAVLAVVVALTWISSTMGRRALVAEIKQRAEFTRRAFSSLIDNRLSALEDVAHGSSVAIESFEPSSEEAVKELIQKSIRSETIIYGSTITYEPNAFPGKEGQVAPYYHRNREGGLTFVDLATPSYNYPEQGWFLIPRETGKPYWTEPYVDVGGGDVAMVTFSHPFFRDGKFQGVATIDIALKDLTEAIREIKVGKTGFAFLVSHKGVFLTIREKEWDLKRTIADVAREMGSEDFGHLGEEMVAGKTGFLSMVEPLGKRKAWFAFGPIEKTNWSLCLVFPEGEMLEEIAALNLRMRAVAIAGIALTALLLFLIASHISRPIMLLADDARRIAAGDFSVRPVGHAGRDEVGILARAFVEMERSLSATLEKLREEKELFQASFSQMSDGLVILDTNFVPVKFNRAAAELLGLPAEGSFIEHLLAHFDAQPPIERITDFSRGAPAFELTRRAGEHAAALHLVMVATPIRSADGEMANLVLTVRDVTELRAEELSKKDFLSTISHKLRTPLAVLQSSVFLIKDGLLGPLAEKQQRHVDTMANQVGRLQALIEALIGFVTIEEQDLVSSREAIDLAQFFAEASGECQKLHPEKHPEVAIQVAPDVGPISFNRDYLRLIMCELVQNALKFNLSDPARITIACSREGAQVAIAVTDNGVGIPPEHHRRIFEKFYQVERYFTGNVEGVGLGLAYVQKIIDHFGGTIEVASKPGEGSTFTIRLPA